MCIYINVIVFPGLQRDLALRAGLLIQRADCGDARRVRLERRLEHPGLVPLPRQRLSLSVGFPGE